MSLLRLRKEFRCPKCGGILEYHIVYVFGDPALGVADEWFYCSVCETRVNYPKVVRKEEPD